MNDGINKARWSGKKKEKTRFSWRIQCFYGGTRSLKTYKWNFKWSARKTRSVRVATERFHYGLKLESFATWINSTVPFKKTQDRENVSNRSLILFFYRYNFLETFGFNNGQIACRSKDSNYQWDWNLSPVEIKNAMNHSTFSENVL